MTGPLSLFWLFEFCWSFILNAGDWCNYFSLSSSAFDTILCLLASIICISSFIIFTWDFRESKSFSSIIVKSALLQKSENPSKSLAPFIKFFSRFSISSISLLSHVYSKESFTHYYSKFAVSSQFDFNGEFFLDRVWILKSCDTFHFIVTHFDEAWIHGLWDTLISQLIGLWKILSVGSFAGFGTKNWALVWLKCLKCLKV